MNLAYPTSDDTQNGIRFLSPVDRISFCIEMGEYSLISKPNEPIPESLVQLFHEERARTIVPLKSFRRSQRAKTGWNSSRYQYLKGINKYHKSIDGKRMHKVSARQMVSKIRKQRSVSGSQFLRVGYA